MDPAILLIIVFILAPLIERLLKAGKQGREVPPPQGRPPQQRGPQQRRPQQQDRHVEQQQDRLPAPQGRPAHHQGRMEQQQGGAQQRDERGWQQASVPRDAPPTAPHRQEEEAAAMLPDDLWEILTGERRAPAPVPVPHDAREEVEEEYAFDAAGPPDVPSAEEWRPARTEDTAVVLPEEAAYVRPVPRRDVPAVVSLEELEFDGALRHEQFHERLEALGGPARVRRRAPNAYRFTDFADVRRAIIMSEILGTPKGLE
ncbi:MAG: hypothetical protein ACRELT_03700 [Longimicrobiales bacterium]